MKRKIGVLIALFCFGCTYSQNKMGNTWIIGPSGDIALFKGDTSKPKTSRFNVINLPAKFSNGHANICDSTTGKVLFATNGGMIWDTAGNIMDNGNFLQPNNFYYANIYPGTSAFYTQSTIILPKGNNQYYVFTASMSDAYFNITLTLPYFLFDIVYYHIVDMNANGGAGKVIVKNKPLPLGGNIMNVIGMQACKHANGKDWWLLKNGRPDDKNKIYAFLVKGDTILPPIVQVFNTPTFDTRGARYGQSCFSKDGSKYAYCTGIQDSFFMADFNRFTGMLSNPKSIKAPVDSLYIQVDPYIDSINTGVCFSDNGKFLYFSRYENIYQYELDEPDPNKAWYTVKHGWDTSAFMGYYGLYKGPDGRIYIGHFSNNNKCMSVIDNPNNKGVACNFCAKCLRHNASPYGLQSPPNMPDYNLGPIYPNSIKPEPFVNKKELLVYPNPAGSVVYIQQIIGNTVSLVNVLGQVVHTQVVINNNAQFNVAHLPRGLYSIKSTTQVCKVVLE
jgi:hypothetical protein